MARADNKKAIRIDIRGKPAVAAVPATTSADGTAVAAVAARQNAVLAVLKTTGVNKRVIHAVHRGLGEDPADDATGESSISISVKDSIIETVDMTVEHEANALSDEYSTTAISSKAGIYAITRLETSTGSILVEVDGSRIKAGSPINAIQKGLGMIAIVVRDSSPSVQAGLGLYANDVFYDSADPLLREVDTLSNLVADPLRQDALVSHPYVIMNVGKPAVVASAGVDAQAAVLRTPAYRLKPPNFDDYGRGIHASLDAEDNKAWIFVLVVNSRIEAQRNRAIHLVHQGVGSADAFPAYPREDENEDENADLRDGGDAVPKDGADQGDRVGDSIVLWIDGSVVKSRAPRDADGDLSPPKYLGREIYVEETETKEDTPDVVEVTGYTPATWESIGAGVDGADLHLDAIHAVVDNVDNLGDLVIGVFDSEIEADGSAIIAHHAGTGNIYVLVGKDDPALPDTKHRVGAVGSVIRSVGNAIEVQQLGGADEVVVEVSGGSDISTDRGAGIHVHETSEKPLKRIGVKVAGVKGGDSAEIYVGKKRSETGVLSMHGVNVLMEKSGTGEIDIDIEYADIKSFLNDGVATRSGVAAFHQGSEGTVDISLKHSSILSWGEAVQVYAASQELMRNIPSEHKYAVDFKVTAVGSTLVSGDGSSSVAVYQFGEGDVSIDVESSAFYAGYGAYRDALTAFGLRTTDYDAAALLSSGAPKNRVEHALVAPSIINATIFSETNTNGVSIVVKGGLLYSKFYDKGSDVAYYVDTEGATKDETKHAAIGVDALRKKGDWSVILSDRAAPIDAADKRAALSYLGARGQGILASHFGVDDPTDDD